MGLFKRTNKTYIVNYMIFYDGAPCGNFQLKISAKSKRLAEKKSDERVVIKTGKIIQDKKKPK